MTLLRFNDEEHIELERDETTGLCSMDSTIDHGSGGSWDAACDTFEAFVLALYAEGIAFDEKLRSAIDTAFDTIANQFN